MALDLAKGVATVVMGEMTDTGIVSRVGASRVEEIAGEASAQYQPPYSLGGTRFLNTYAHNVAYEHIYLTGVYETWVGVPGTAGGAGRYGGVPRLQDRRRDLPALLERGGPHRADDVPVQLLRGELRGRAVRPRRRRRGAQHHRGYRHVDPHRVARAAGHHPAATSTRRTERGHSTRGAASGGCLWLGATRAPCRRACGSRVRRHRPRRDRG